MILVFEGRGWVVPVTAMVAGGLCALTGLKDPLVFWPVIGLSGVVDHYLGRRWEKQEGRWVQDLMTGEITEEKPTHSFFWVPVKYWLYVKLALAGLLVWTVLQRPEAVQ